MSVSSLTIPISSLGYTAGRIGSEWAYFDQFTSIDLLRRRFVLRFEIPSGHITVRRLQDVLTQEDNHKGLVHSLSGCIALAKKIASGLSFVRAGGIVHKKVNPTDVFVLETASGEFPHSLGKPYLTGFDIVVIREELGKSLGRSCIEQVDGKPIVVFRYLIHDRLKEHYLHLAQKRIPPTLGTTKYGFVKSCLENLPNTDGTPHDAKSSVESSSMEKSRASWKRSMCERGDSTPASGQDN